jgi:hypothetical protein
MCFLDEGVCEQAQRVMPDKVFRYLPDITENALPLTESALVREIKDKARGRKIVFMGGTIGGNKNLACWYQLIHQADIQEFYFVQIGEMFENTLTSEDVHELEKYVQKQNAYTHMTLMKIVVVEQQLRQLKVR